MIKKLLTIIGLLVTVSLNSQIRKDYIDHYACGYLAGWSTGVLSGDYKGCKPIIISAGSAFVIGGAKELIYDKWLGRGTPEWKDLFATTLGGISAGVTIKMFAGLSKNKRNKHIFYHDRKRTEIHRR